MSLIKTFIYFLDASSKDVLDKQQAEALLQKRYYENMRNNQYQNFFNTLVNDITFQISQTGNANIDYPHLEEYQFNQMLNSPQGAEFQGWLADEKVQMITTFQKNGGPDLPKLFFYIDPKVIGEETEKNLAKANQNKEQAPQNSQE